MDMPQSNSITCPVQYYTHWDYLSGLFLFPPYTVVKSLHRAIKMSLNPKAVFFESGHNLQQQVGHR